MASAVNYTPQSKELSSGVCVVSVALKKKWARSATYWVDIWKVPFKATVFWYAVRRWSFVRKGESKNEKVQGEIPGSRRTSFGLVVEDFKDLLELQINDEKGYEVDTAITAPKEVDSGLAEVEKFINAYRWSSRESVHVEPEPEPEQPQLAKFAEAVKKRKKDASW